MAFSSFKNPGTRIPTLKKSEVQIWRISLLLDNQSEDQLRALLSADEIERANRFHFNHLRTHYIAARSALRKIIGGHTQTQPSDINFSYTKHEKPYLAGSELQFNVSHSHEIALIALSWGRKVGVDIEHTRPNIDQDQIARRFFAPAEFEDYLSVAEDHRTQAFYNCWTRKEAYIKAIGDGLTFPLDQFRVSLKPGDPAELLEVRKDKSAGKHWKLIAVNAGEGYTAALICKGRDWNLTGWQHQTT